MGVVHVIGLARISEGVPMYGGVIVYNMNNVALGFWRDSQVDGGDPSVGCGGGVGWVLSRVESCGVASVGCGRVSA